MSNKRGFRTEVVYRNAFARLGRMIEWAEYYANNGDIVSFMEHVAKYKVITNNAPMVSLTLKYIDEYYYDQLFLNPRFQVTYDHYCECRAKYIWNDNTYVGDDICIIEMPSTDSHEYFRFDLQKEDLFGNLNNGCLPTESGKFNAPDIISAGLPARFIVEKWLHGETVSVDDFPKKRMDLSE